MRKTRYQNLNHKKINEDDPFDHQTVHCPKSLTDKMKQISKERGVPISRLWAYAADNELDYQPSFNYNIELPNTTYQEFEFAHEASLILKYMNRYFKNGTGLDTLVLFRREMGIESRVQLLGGFRELLMKDMLVEFYPNKAKFNYPENHRYYKPKRDVLTDINNRTKTIRAYTDSVKKGPLDDIG